VAWKEALVQELAKVYGEYLIWELVARSHLASGRIDDVEGARKFIERLREWRKKIKEWIVKLLEAPEPEVREAVRELMTWTFTSFGRAREGYRLDIFTVVEVLMMFFVGVEPPPRSDIIAATDGRKLYLNPALRILGRSNAEFVGIHEGMHNVLAHPSRGQMARDHELFNVAADVIINEIIKDAGLGGDLFPGAVGATFDRIAGFLRYVCLVPEDEMIKREELGVRIDELGLYKWLEAKFHRYCSQVRVPRPGKWVEEEARGIPVPVPMPREGEPLPKPGAVPSNDIKESRETREAAEAKRLATARQAAKNGAAHLAGLFLQDLEVRFDWREILREAFGSVGRRPLSTWLRPSRRFPAWPGTKWVGQPKVVVMVDVSGSVIDYDVHKFFAAIRRLMHEYPEVRLLVYAWDTQLYEQFDSESGEDPEEALRRLKIGGGGTALKTPLKRALADLESKDLSLDESTSFVIFTDGEIADDGDPELTDLLRYVATNVGCAALIFTVRNPRSFGPEWVKVHLVDP